MDLNLIHQLIWEIDNEDDVMEYSFSNNICIWLVIRYHIYTLLLKKAIRSFQVPVVNPTAKRNFFKEKINHLNYLLASYKRNPLSSKEQFECLNVCSSLGCAPSANGYKSRISGFLNDHSSLRTLNLIKSNRGVYRNAYAGNYRFYDFILLKEALKQKAGAFNNKADTLSSKAIECFMESIQNKLSNYLSEKEFERIRVTLKQYASEASGLETSFKTILTNISPKLLIIEDANYGSIDTSIFIKSAKELNIKTAEIQHGIFDVGFQYSAKLVGHTLFAKHKTDFVLTFGDYFSDFIKSSSKNISIGNRFLEIKERELKNREISTSVEKILLITQREFTDNIIPIVYNALKGITKHFQLIIRLHPSDVDSQQKYQSFFQLCETKFSIEDDIYSQIRDVDYIIGSYSFALFESLFFGKTPFIHNNMLSKHFIPDGTGISFTSATELGALLEAPPPQIKNDRREYFWKQGSEANFKCFYEREVLQDK